MPVSIATSRRGARWATGLAMSGASVLGLVLVALVPLLLDAYGWRGTLLVMAAISFNLLACGALLRPLKTPKESPGPARGRWGLWRLLRHGPFLRYSLAFVLVDAGYFVPHVHGPARAHEVGCDEHQAGQAMAGDGGGRRVLSVWLAPRLAVPLLHHLFGFCGGTVVPLQFTGVAEVMGAGRLLHAIGLMQMLESVGSLLGAPLAGWLRDLTGDFTAPFLVAGTFIVAGSLLIFTLPGFCTSQGDAGNGGGQSLAPGEAPPVSPSTP
ncbi:LOW QUALITY PROTEIN: monocarboxylate transporter 13-like [Anas acuta]|uniref:LOW QUALITY PROTEIN: monocarboxylate transporter 13-like n=1 Tax=Anas acuta TaxID=28680 RepID=UPI0035C8F6DA